MSESLEEQRQKKLEFIFQQVMLFFENTKRENQKIVNYSHQFLYWMILLIPAEITYLSQRLLVVPYPDNIGAFCIFLVLIAHLFVIFKYLIPLTRTKKSYVSGDVPKNLLNKEAFVRNYDEYLGFYIQQQEIYIESVDEQNSKMGQVFKRAVYLTFIPFLVAAFCYFIYFIVTFLKT